jgi:WhiB family redox-sensing transcriptional regulator
MTILGLIDPIRNPQPWATLAACGAKGVEPELFFPRSNESSVVAKLICAGCPVRRICLVDAVSHKQAGIRGGFTEDERRWMRLGKLPDMPPVKCGKGHDLLSIGTYTARGKQVCKQCTRDRNNNRNRPGRTR